MVHIVGAGPGATDLITVRGARLLGEADVVIYAGSLVSAGMLKLCRKAAPEIFRGAGPGCVSGKCSELKSCGSPRQEREWDA